MPAYPAHNTQHLITQEVHLEITQMLEGQWLIGIDICDVESVLGLSGTGFSLMGVGAGLDRGAKAAEAIIAQALAKGWSLNQAEGILIIIRASDSFHLDDYYAVMTSISQAISSQALVIVGAILDPAMADQLRITLVATGIEH
jgi:cell division protein FtsZ